MLNIHYTVRTEKNGKPQLEHSKFANLNRSSDDVNANPVVSVQVHQFRNFRLNQGFSVGPQ